LILINGVIISRKMNQQERLIKVICPICTKEKVVKILESVVSNSKALTTISIQKNEICEHHFQAFIDKDYQVRGYQKVDYEIVTKNKFPKGNFFIKVIVVGDYEVGKTAITRRFVENQFEEGNLPTIQLKISKKQLKFDETYIDVMIWDIGGQAFHMSPYRARFYEGAQSAIIVTDRTRKKTLENAEIWYKDMLKSIPNKIPIFLVGNKSDLIDKIVLSEKELNHFANKFNFNFFLASAKTGQNIEELFVKLIESFFDNQRF